MPLAAVGARPRSDDHGRPAQCTLDRVTKRFGATVAVDDVSLEIRRGEMFGLIGPDGAGKTTTIRLICGLLRADGGRSAVLGRDPVRQHAAVTRSSRLPLAALQPLRRPQHRREHRVLRRDPRRHRLRRAAQPAARHDAAHAVPRPAGRPAVGRHEAEARARVHARPRAAAHPARRADDRRRPGVAPRVLEAAVRVPRAGHHHRHGDAVPGRGRALLARRRCSRAGACSRRHARRRSASSLPGIVVEVLARPQRAAIEALSPLPGVADVAELRRADPRAVARRRRRTRRVGGADRARCSANSGIDVDQRPGGSAPRSRTCSSTAGRPAS